MRFSSRNFCFCLEKPNPEPIYHSHLLSLYWTSNFFTFYYKLSTRKQTHLNIFSLFRNTKSLTYHKIKHADIFFSRTVTTRSFKPVARRISYVTTFCCFSLFQWEKVRSHLSISQVYCCVLEFLKIELHEISETVHFLQKVIILLKNLF